MKVKRLYAYKPYNEHFCKLKKCKNVLTLTTVNSRNDKQTIQKINKDEYVFLETGELKQYKHTENRSENTKSVRESIGRLRDLINNNFSGGKNELWITLTFGENKVYEPKKLLPYFELFIKRLRYKYSSQKIDYIYIPEPHEKGDWHIHLLLKSNKSLVIPNKILSELWGEGFVKVNRLKNIDNVGAYVSAYLIDIKEGECTKKGARLYLYPTGHHIYRNSKGIIKPETIITTYAQAQKEVNIKNLVYEETIQIETEEGYKNIIHYEQYNIKRQD